jgi:prepilin-type processing-associated H-X9-DG protein
MDRILDSAKRAQWIKHTAKVVAVAASSGAALVSIVTALVSYGVIGQAESHQSIGNIGAAWVGLRPAIDTATAFGDTVHFAATVTDRNGSILVGARPSGRTDRHAGADAEIVGNTIGEAGEKELIVGEISFPLFEHLPRGREEKASRVGVGEPVPAVVHPAGVGLRYLPNVLYGDGHAADAHLEVDAVGANRDDSAD